jgi:ADP-heptose:LPS heptosyltransferase
MELNGIFSFIMILSYNMARIIRKRDPIKKPLSVREFHEKKNKILILRETGGLGDILLHRHIFEDFKRVMPDVEVVFACPTKYHEAVADHPYVNEVVDSRTVKYHDYIAHYNTTSACTRHEMRHVPMSNKNRSDIWANHCGVLLTRHNMHITLDEETIKFGKKKLQEAGHRGDRPSVIINPISAMLTKDLQDWQIEGLIDGLRERGMFVMALHLSPIDGLPSNVPQLYGIRIKEWMGVLNAADYIISVDSAAFHFAGGIGKPLTGIFTFADGKVYGRHYDFVLVQKHRDDGNWECGPCYNWPMCPKETKSPIKPCCTEITIQMMLDGVDKMIEKWPWKTS